MAYIILVDLRESNGHVLFIKDDNDNVMQFGTYKEAEDLSKIHKLLQAFPFRIIDLDE